MIGERDVVEAVQLPGGVALTHDSLSPKIGGRWHTLWWVGPVEGEPRLAAWSGLPEEAALFPSVAAAVDAFGDRGGGEYRLPDVQLMIGDSLSPKLGAGRHAL